jgi:RNA polymerase sigma-70 factor, ECF subfamily
MRDAKEAMNAPSRPAAGGLSLDGSVTFPCVAAAWASHEAELRAYLRHRLNDEAAADDLLQDVFVKAMRHQGTFCGLDNPRAWLFQVARNALVDRARTQHPAEPIDDYQDQLAAPAPDALSAVDALAACLATVMGRLAAADTAILHACDIEGQSQREFAAAHALTLPAAKARLLRARRRLREQLVLACGVRFDVEGRVCCHAQPQMGGPAAGP